MLFNVVLTATGGETVWARPDRPDETALFTAIRAIAGGAVITQSIGSTFARELAAVAVFEEVLVEDPADVAVSTRMSAALRRLSGFARGVSTPGAFLPGCGSVAEMEGLLAGARFPAADTDRRSVPGLRIGLEIDIFCDSLYSVLLSNAILLYFLGPALSQPQVCAAGTWNPSAARPTLRLMNLYEAGADLVGSGPLGHWQIIWRTPGSNAS